MQKPRKGGWCETNMPFDNRNGLKVDSAETSSGMTPADHGLPPSVETFPFTSHSISAVMLGVLLPQHLTGAYSAQLLIAKSVKRSRCSPVQRARNTA